MALLCAHASLELLALGLAPIAALFAALAVFMQAVFG
jgi:hypothetical protein